MNEPTPNPGRFTLAAVDSTNVNQILSGLDLPSGVAADIRSQVAAGKVVSLPSTEAGHGRWTGIGYAVVDPTTGDSGFMLAGGLAGASVGIEEGLWAALAMVLVAGPIDQTVDVMAWITSEISLGASFGEAVVWLNKNSSGLEMGAAEAKLAAVYTLCANSLVGILAASTTTEIEEGVVNPAGFYTNACVNMAMGVASLAVGITFWISTVLVEEGVD